MLLRVLIILLLVAFYCWSIIFLNTYWTYLKFLHFKYILLLDIKGEKENLGVYQNNGCVKSPIARKEKVMDKKILKFLLAMLPTFLMLHLLRMFFPYTGLGRILVIPQIIIINYIIIIVGLKMASNKNKRNIWVAMILLTLIVAIFLWPQEFNPPVYKQLFNKIRG